MLPLSSKRSSTRLMSNCAYLASRTPRAMFSKSQNKAMLRVSWVAIFLVRLLRGEGHGGRGDAGGSGATAPVQPSLQPLEVEVDHRGDVQRENLGKHQAADDRESEGPAGFAADADRKRDRKAAHQRGHRGHHDRAEADHAGFEDRLLRRLAALPLRL